MVFAVSCATFLAYRIQNCNDQFILAWAVPDLGKSLVCENLGPCGHLIQGAAVGLSILRPGFLCSSARATMVGFGSFQNHFPGVVPSIGMAGVCMWNGLGAISFPV